MGAAYHPGFGEVVEFRFDPLPDDPDGQVRETIARVCEYLRQDATHPLLQAQAAEALQLGNGDPIAGVWMWVKRNMRFRHDEDIANDLQTADPRKLDTLEVLIRPVDQALLIERGGGFEDCDGFEMYACCLLTALGIPVNLVTVSSNPDHPRLYSHVYGAAYVNGERVPLDFSHGPYPGWECPNTGRLKEWPISSASNSSASTLAAIAVAGGLFLTYRLLRKAA